MLTRTGKYSGLRAMASKGRVTDADGQRWDNSGWPHYGALTWKYIYLGQAHMDGLREIGRAVRVEACGRLAEASVPRKLIAEFVVATLAVGCLGVSVRLVYIACKPHIATDFTCFRRSCAQAAKRCAEAARKLRGSDWSMWMYGPICLMQ